MKRSWRLLALSIAVAAPQVVRAQADPALFDPVQGYRLSHYRGVVPVAPEGVPRIDEAAAERLWRAHALFLDMTPAEGAVRDPDTGRWALAEPHASIPGAHWFPEAGRGVLADGIGDWFLGGVRAVVRANPKKPIVVFCLADCWMSWNAALRLHRAGFRDVRWFANGIDGWKARRLPLADVVPSPAQQARAE